MTPKTKEAYGMFLGRRPYFLFRFKTTYDSPLRQQEMRELSPALFELYLLGLINIDIRLRRQHTLTIEILTPHEITKVKMSIVKRSQDDEIGKFFRENDLPTVY